MTKKKNPLLTKSESLSESWKYRLAYTDGLFGTSFHNSWRAILFTIRGKNIGCEERWKQFYNFKADMLPSHVIGHRLARKDKTLPFSKDNCHWVFPGDLNNSRLTMLEYDGYVMPLKDWCLKYDLSYNGVKQRYHRGKGYSAHEILFGIKFGAKKAPIDQATLTSAALKTKASKMISAYKCRDKKRGHVQFDIEIEWFVNEILKKPCTYCGALKNIGADRLDNKLPHTINNIVPCCFRCNTVRMDYFTYEQMIKIGTFLRDVIDIEELGGHTN